MELPVIMSDFLNVLGEENINEKTIEAYRLNLKDFSEYMFDSEPVVDVYESFTSEDFMEWINHIRATRNLSASTLNQKIATLSRFYTFLQGRKLVSVNVPKTLGKIKETEAYERPILTTEEATTFLNKAREKTQSGKYADYRNELILNIFIYTGLRLEELEKISVGDINSETGLLKVTGKRGKTRKVCLPTKVLVMYNSYLKIRSLQGHSDDEALFLSRQKSDNGYRLSHDQIRRQVIKIAKEANVTSITPHSLRHTCATVLIEKGANLNYVSQLLGHSSTQTTERIYIHQSDKAIIQMANTIEDAF